MCLEDDARSARSNSSSDSSGEDEEEAEDPEVNDYRAEARQKRPCLRVAPISFSGWLVVLSLLKFGLGFSILMKAG